MSSLRVAVFQKKPVFGDVHETTRRISSDLAWCDRENVQLAVFPECYLQGYTLDRHTLERRAITLDGPAAQGLLEALTPVRAMCVTGLIERHDRSIFNAAVAIHRGAVAGRYRKARLHRKESAFDAGSGSSLFEVGGWPFGVNICYEANFPELASSLAWHGVRLICYPLNNMLLPDVAERWRQKSIENLRQRAIETGCWVVSADVVGEHEGMISHGCTRIVSPMGEDVQWVSEGNEGVAVFDLQS